MDEIGVQELDGQPAAMSTVGSRKTRSSSVCDNYNKSKWHIVFPVKEPPNPKVYRFSNYHKRSNKISLDGNTISI